MASFGAPFFYLYACMQQSVIIAKDFRIRNTVRVHAYDLCYFCSDILTMPEIGIHAAHRVYAVGSNKLHQYTGIPGLYTMRAGLSSI